jgi:non-homologous end joining protein Ku
MNTQQEHRPPDQISKLDAESGDEVESTDIIKGYQVRKGRIPGGRDFVPHKEIDELYFNNRYLNVQAQPRSQPD